MDFIYIYAKQKHNTPNIALELESNYKDVTV